MLMQISLSLSLSLSLLITTVTLFLLFVIFVIHSRWLREVKHASTLSKPQVLASPSSLSRADGSRLCDVGCVIFAHFKCDMACFTCLLIDLGINQGLDGAMLCHALLDCSSTQAKQDPTTAGNELIRLDFQGEDKFTSGY